MLLTLKKGCFLTSSASFSLAPNLLSGFRLSNWKKKKEFRGRASNGHSSENGMAKSCASQIRLLTERREQCRASESLHIPVRLLNRFSLANQLQERNRLYCPFALSNGLVVTRLLRSNLDNTSLILTENKEITKGWQLATGNHGNLATSQPTKLSRSTHIHRPKPRMLGGHMTGGSRATF